MDVRQLIRTIHDSRARRTVHLRTRAAAAAVLIILCAPALRAQQPVTPVAPHAAVADTAKPAPLTVRLECDACGSDTVPAAGWLARAGEAAEPDVHVRVVPLPRGDGDSASFAISFHGRGRFAGTTDSVLFTTAAPTDTVAPALLHAVMLGLVRYAAATPLAPHIRIGWAPPAAARNEAPAGRPAAAPAAGRQQDTRAAREARRWAAGVELGFSGSSGNSDFIALTSGIRVRHLQTNRFRLDWAASFRYGESGGTVAARHAQSKLDFDLGPSARVAPFISMSGERDPFRRIDLRGRGGTGVRLVVHKDQQGEASLRGGVLYTHERFRSETGLAPRSDGVWSFKFTGSRQLGSSVKVENASSYDPRLGDIGDYNLDVTSTMSTRISRRLALTLSHTYAYDASPVEGVQPSDQRFQTGLSLDF